ncbi:MAG: hypothetical protein ATN35_08895 [Epulopiscium sp. Nele67-Bin004]|nr:MAG: hypothetical protein ATN35_08895 [Epulopiscium sp. Nele67-Bin004]
MSFFDIKLFDSGNGIFDVGLVDLAHHLGVKSKDKDEIIPVLEEFYTSQDKIREVWQQLNKFEQEFIYTYIKNSGYMYNVDLDYLAKKYKIKQAKGHYLHKSSKVALFIPAGNIVSYVEEFISKNVRGTNHQVTAQMLTDKHLDSLCTRVENSVQDITNTIKLIEKEKLKTSQNFWVKDSILKVNSILNNKEYETTNVNLHTFEISGNPTKLHGLWNILHTAKLVTINDNFQTTTKTATKFLSCTPEKQIKYLLLAYIDSTTINEVSDIDENKFITETQNLSSARKSILKAIKTLPVDEWISVSDFNNKIFKQYRNFVMSAVGKISIDNDCSWYDTKFVPNWDKFERRIIDVMCTKYLANIGILDIALEEIILEDSPIYGKLYQLVPKYIKLTPIGAYTIGKNSNYKPTPPAEPENHLEINDKLQIILRPSKQRVLHEIYFDRICSKKKENNIIYYDVNSQTVAVAQSQGISIEILLEYLTTHCTKPLPKSLHQTLDGWKKDKSKVKIRTITVIECEDETILNGIVEMPSVKCHIIDTPTYFATIKETGKSKIKNDLEDNFLFCTVE